MGKLVFLALSASAILLLGYGFHVDDAPVLTGYFAGVWIGVSCCYYWSFL